MPALIGWIKFLLFVVLVNVGLYAAEIYFAWPTVVRATVGIVVAMLGLFFVGGGAGGSYLLEQADARAVNHDDIQRYVNDRSRSLGFGARMILLGGVTFTMTFVIP